MAKRKRGTGCSWRACDCMDGIEVFFNLDELQWQNLDAYVHKVMIPHEDVLYMALIRGLIDFGWEEPTYPPRTSNLPKHIPGDLDDDVPF